MTTNADYTFTPGPFTEAAQNQWDMSLHRIEDEGENQAVAAHLRSLWKENWWKYPDDIKRSFLSAARKNALTKTNNHSPSSHILYRGSVLFNRYDFDWGVWLVLRGIYYDVHKNDMSPRAQMTCLTFGRGTATRMMTERHPGIDVLEENVPPTFPPRPLSWDRKSGDESGSSRAPTKSKNRVVSVNNQKSTGTDGRVRSAEAGSHAETTGDESHSSPPDSATSKVEKGAEPHTLASSGGSHPRENLNLAPSGLDAGASIATDDSNQKTLQVQTVQNVNPITGDSGLPPNDGKNRVASEQSPVNEGGHQREKAANTSNDGNLRSVESNNVHKSLLKRSMSDDEEEDSPCGELHARKRRGTSSDQSHSAESGTTPNSGSQMAISGENLDRIHELLKKHLNERVVECVSQQVARQAESLQPRLKDQIVQFLPEKIFGVTESSGLSSISQKVVDSMAERLASKITRQIMQQVAQQVTRELTSELQPKADKQIADCIAEIMLEKLLGPDGNFGV
ncbi:hypothetical protein N0V84_009510 [Fusarium piperis]|uniref:Uncharacterized protein n=1 Tax=Fusarium piperis TaxID=1435070 RepID=A0A9W8W643_9HYPO|nr:hypothetical protein N0V84_009510 [Fusarium piperis]